RCRVVGVAGEEVVDAVRAPRTLSLRAGELLVRRAAVRGDVAVAHALIGGRLAGPRPWDGIVARAVVEARIVAVVRHDGRIDGGGGSLHLDDVDERAGVGSARDLFPVEDRRGHVEGRVGRVKVGGHPEHTVDLTDVVVLSVDVDAARLDGVVVAGGDAVVVVPRGVKAVGRN